MPQAVINLAHHDIPCCYSSPTMATQHAGSFSQAVTWMRSCLEAGASLLPERRLIVPPVGRAIRAEISRRFDYNEGARSIIQVFSDTRNTNAAVKETSQLSSKGGPARQLHLNSKGFECVPGAFAEKCQEQLAATAHYKPSNDSRPPGPQDAIVPSYEHDHASRGFQLQGHPAPAANEAAPQDGSNSMRSCAQPSTMSRWGIPARTHPPRHDDVTACQPGHRPPPTAMHTAAQDCSGSWRTQLQPSTTSRWALQNTAHPPMQDGTDQDGLHMCATQHSSFHLQPSPLRCTDAHNQQAGCAGDTGHPSPCMMQHAQSTRKDAQQVRYQAAQQQQQQQQQATTGATRRPTSLSKGLIARLETVLDESAADAKACPTADQQQQQQHGQRWAWLGAERHDAQGHPPGHPQYDATTLHIPEPAMRSMTNFNRQFWQLKKQAMDVVLFVRHGSFYNLFDVDADVGMRVGLALSGQPQVNMWKCGCNKDAFPTWCAKVLALGYSVGRVEEVKAASRNEAGKGGTGGDILTRRLVRIYTPGTMADAYLADEEQVTGGLGNRPAIALVEGPGGRLGVAVLYVGLGQLHVGQLPDRVHLQGLLLQHAPIEAVAAPDSLAPGTLHLLARYSRVSAPSLGACTLPSTGASGSCPLLCMLPFNCFASSQSGFFHVMHTDSHIRCDMTSAALAHCQHLLQPLLMAQQGASPEQACMGPVAVMQAMSQLAPAQPLALHAVTVLLQHLQRCQVLKDACRCLEVHPLGATPATGGHACRGAAPMQLGYAVLTTCEVLEGSLGGRQGSLLQQIDGTATHMGTRKLRQWLVRPLGQAKEVEERLQVVELFMACEQLRTSFQATLASLPDLQRLMRHTLQALEDLTQAQGQDDDEDNAEGDTGAGWQVAARKSHLTSLHQLLAGLLVALEAVYELRTGLQQQRPQGLRAPLLQRVIAAAGQVMPTLESLLQVFDIEEEPQGQHTFAEVQLRPGQFPAYDQACAQLQASQQERQQLLERLKLALVTQGASTAHLRRMLPVGQQGRLKAPIALEPLLCQLGFQVLQKSGASMLCTHPQLVQADSLAAQLQQQHDLVVSQLVCEAAKKYYAGYGCLSGFLDGLASLDVLAGFAVTTHPSAAPSGCCYCRPKLEDATGQTEPYLWLDNLWHPCLASTRRADTPQGCSARIVPNTLRLGRFPQHQEHHDSSSSQHAPHMLLLTGANMGGKSTLLRATCCAAIMAHLGCYVPASGAALSTIDAIFTRMGAHDHIMAGESTFMVEMSETAVSLANATSRSLVILDELGRGTATHDGYAIAFAVLLYLAQKIQPRVLFATHYHDLTREPGLQGYALLAHMAHTESAEGAFVPLHELRPGPAQQGSSGVEVAGMAGLPAVLLSRAREQSAALAARMQQRHCQPLPLQHAEGTAFKHVSIGSHRGTISALAAGAIPSLLKGVFKTQKGVGTHKASGDPSTSAGVGLQSRCNAGQALSRAEVLLLQRACQALSNLRPRPHINKHLQRAQAIRAVQAARAAVHGVTY